MSIRLTYMTFNHVKSSTCPSAACLASVAAFSPQGTRFAFFLPVPPLLLLLPALVLAHSPLPCLRLERTQAVPALHGEIPAWVGGLEVAVDPSTLVEVVVSASLEACLMYEHPC